MDYLQFVRCDNSCQWVMLPLISSRGEGRNDSIGSVWKINGRTSSVAAQVVVVELAAKLFYAHDSGAGTWASNDV